MMLVGIYLNSSLFEFQSKNNHNILSSSKYYLRNKANKQTKKTKMLKWK